MNWSLLEDKIAKIIGDANEAHADFATRLTIAHNIAAEVNSFITNPYPVVDCTQLVADGMMSLGKLLSREQVDDIHRYIADKKVYNSHVPYGDGIPRDINDSHSQSSCYSPIDVITCPHLLELALSEKILSLVSSYLGCLPVLYSMNMWWTKRSTSQNIQSWHRDFDDFAFLALFIYLVDVDGATGPHVYVKQTHVRRDETAYLFPPNSYPYPSFESHLGQHIETLTGEAGSAYLLDTYGIHKGSENVQKPRLVLWLRYGLHQNPPSRVQIPEPFFVNASLDETAKYVTRILLN